MVPSPAVFDMMKKAVFASLTLLAGLLCLAAGSIVLGATFVLILFESAWWSMGTLALAGALFCFAVAWLRRFDAMARTL